MWTIYQYTLCPFSRKIRILLGEKGVPHDLATAYPWEKGNTLLALNPAGETPAIQNKETGHILIDSAAICEYFEETIRETSLWGNDAAKRAEARRLAAWFDIKFFAEVTAPLLRERMYKRLTRTGALNATALRNAMRLGKDHMDYLEHLLDHRRWIAGDNFGLADIAAAAQLSVADYLSGIHWGRHPGVKQWYSALKSRPSIRPLLAERMEGVHPPDHYQNPDF